MPRNLLNGIFGLFAFFALYNYAVVSEASTDIPIFTFQYAGQAFNVFPVIYFGYTDQFTPRNHFAFEFSIIGPIRHDSTYFLVGPSGIANPTLLSWSATDGSSSFSSDVSQDILVGGFVTTTKNGRISSWSISINSLEYPQIAINSCGPNPCMSSIGVSGEYAGEYDQFAGLYSGISTSPGAWTALHTDDLGRSLTPTSTSIPEPGSRTLFLLGLIGLVTFKALPIRRPARQRRL